MSVRIPAASQHSPTTPTVAAPTVKLPRVGGTAVKTFSWVAVWLFAMVALEQAFQRGFGFAVADAWLLAGGLLVMIGVMIVILLAVGYAVRRGY